MYNINLKVVQSKNFKGNNMSTYMYLDDDVFHPSKKREPETYYKFLGRSDMVEKMKSYENIILVASVEDAQEHINKNGCPDFISFDNDLGRELEGVHLAQWLVEKDLDEPGFIPDGFEFVVHSQNNIAGKRLMNYLDGYLSYRNKANSDKPRKGIKP